MKDYRNIFNKVVPYHTDNSMSLYEFVGRLYEYIKNFEGTLDEAHEKIDEFTTYITSDIEEFKTSTTGEIADFIDRFDVQLDETTAQILTEWKDDGTLEQIINLVWEGKADKFYVDNLLNQLANTLTDNYTQADEDLRDQINASVATTIDNVRGLITDNTQEIGRVESDLSATQQLAENAMEGANRTFISNARPTVLEWAMEQTLGLHYFTTESDTPDVPAGFTYSTGILMVRNDQQRTVLIVGYRTGKIVSNTYVNGEWLGWKEASGDQTALNILAKIREVDGEGSGLDADTLDGLHGFEFARKAHTHDMSGVYPVVDSTIMQGADTPDKFVNLISVDGSYRYVFTVKFGAYNYAQFSLPYVSHDAKQLYIAFRSRYQPTGSTATWSDWQRLYSTKHGTSDPPTLQPGEIYLKY